MNRKGISPLIASVLILAVTLSVASVFSGWAPQLLETVTDQTENQTLETVECNQASINIESVTYNSTADEVNVAIRNTGDSDLEEIQVAAWVDSLPDQDATTSVNSGDQTTVTISSQTSEPDEVRAYSTSCPDVTSSESTVTTTS